jgi:hypothetical protein
MWWEDLGETKLEYKLLEASFTVSPEPGHGVRMRGEVRPQTV